MQPAILPLEIRRILYNSTARNSFLHAGLLFEFITYISLLCRFKLFNAYTVSAFDGLKSKHKLFKFFFSLKPTLKK